MTKETTINKLMISLEAKQDYECLLEKRMLTSEIKKEVDEYFIHIESKLNTSYYFRIKYAEEDCDKMLMLFIYKDKKIGSMQLWRLAGICFEEDWSEELEDSGQVRFWLNTKITDLPEESDWVVKHLVWKEEQERLQKELEI